MADPTDPFSKTAYPEQEGHGGSEPFSPAPIEPGMEKRAGSKMLSLKRIGLVVLINIVAGITIAVAVRYGFDYVYSRLHDSGLTPRLPPSVERTEKRGPIDVYLIPLDSFPVATADQLGRVLSKELGLRIWPTPSASIGPGKFDETRQQYVAELLAEPVVRVVQQLGTPSRKTAYVGLLNADMYPANADWRYALSMHFEGRISVVATGRLIPYGVLSREEAARVYGLRLLKLVKRAIGEQYFGFPRSADRNCVMYSPLLSADELDKIGYDFEQPAYGASQ